MFTISIEGNIGAGKTTLLSLLKDTKNPNFDIFIEPINDWKEIFEKFEKNPIKYAYELQQTITYSLTKREDIIKKSKKRIIFVERSIESSLNIFCKILNKNKNLNNEEYIKLIHENQNRKNIININLILFINTPIDICMNRIKERKQIGDNIVNKQYLIDIHNAYINWLKHSYYLHHINVLNDIKCLYHTHVIDIDGTKPFDIQTLILNITKLLNIIKQ